MCPRRKLNCVFCCLVLRLVAIGGASRAKVAFRTG